MEIAFAMPDTIGRLEKRLTAELADEAEQWSWCLNSLSRWEDEHLLGNPSPELLAEHKKTVERLLRFGRLISVATGHPDFPDRAVASMVQATKRTLEDNLRIYHGSGMSKEESDRILSKAFPG
jgi:hypothetical protein